LFLFLQTEGRRSRAQENASRRGAAGRSGSADGVSTVNVGSVAPGGVSERRGSGGGGGVSGAPAAKGPSGGARVANGAAGAVPRPGRAAAAGGFGPGTGEPDIYR